MLVSQGVGPEDCTCNQCDNPEDPCVCIYTYPNPEDPYGACICDCGDDGDSSESGFFPIGLAREISITTRNVELGHLGHFLSILSPAELAIPARDTRRPITLTTQRMIFGDVLDTLGLIILNDPRPRGGPDIYHPHNPR